MEFVNDSYRKFVYDIIKRNEDIVPFIWDGIEVGLSHKEFILVCYSILKQRPRNRPMAKKLWDYIRFTDKPVPSFISEFSQERYFELVFEPHKSESKQVASSIARSSIFNEAYKGFVYAVNIDTMDIIPITSPSEAVEKGFNPGAIQLCVDNKQYTHKNHVFIIDKEESYGGLKRAISEGSSGLPKATREANHG